MHTATQKYARISARKVRALADLVRGKFADEALDILRFQPHRGARMLEKVIKSALGNAEHAQAHGRRRPRGGRCRGWTSGPMFKRIRPRARGMAFGIKRRMSHIKVALDRWRDRERTAERLPERTTQPKAPSRPSRADAESTSHRLPHRHHRAVEEPLVCREEGFPRPAHGGLQGPEVPQDEVSRRRRSRRWRSSGPATK